MMEELRKPGLDSGFYSSSLKYWFLLFSFSRKKPPEGGSYNIHNAMINALQ
jgi:hypothetical protein